MVFGALAIGAPVPAAVMSVAAGASFTRDIYVEYVHPTAHREQAAITLQLLGGVWILQTFPTVAV